MRIEKFDTNHKKLLIDILTAERWDFHSAPEVALLEVEKNLENGLYTTNGNETFLMFNDMNQVIGFFRLFDLGEDHLDDETPLFDIRIKKSERNRQAGTYAVKWLTDYVFSTFPNKNRLEATTRYDNTAMRRVLERCGFAKEAHYREAWPTSNGMFVDTVAYGILRRDWEQKEITPVDWSN